MYWYQWLQWAKPWEMVFQKGRKFLVVQSFFTHFSTNQIDSSSRDTFQEGNVITLHYNPSLETFPSWTHNFRSGSPIDFFNWCCSMYPSINSRNAYKRSSLVPKYSHSGVSKQLDKVVLNSFALSWLNMFSPRLFQIFLQPLAVQRIWVLSSL